MSMGVGDSSDLIHGGGGSLRVFWLSRTDFEKKLLVVVCVLSIAVVGLTVGVAVLAARNAAVSCQTLSLKMSEATSDTHSITPTPTPTLKQASSSPLIARYRRSTHTTLHTNPHTAAHPHIHTVVAAPLH
ncbi:uncharacterized protein LOC123511209 [Portunus trituberculatus]|uniref:uncharacterized protein LOC123511209 n=1 Tax=Portunus trituberculatus TaxID=210409 RepID=UPI001E1D131D|nr:uncharacterized protein LOC123511209 [Portunus trituberculatus]